MLGDAHRGAMARGLLRTRLARERSFPADLFDERGWVMLLHLFVALCDNETVGEAGLIRRTATPTRVGRAWLKHLVAQGLIVIEDGGDDVRMTADAINRMRTFLDDAMAIRTGTIGC